MPSDYVKAADRAAHAARLDELCNAVERVLRTGWCTERELMTRTKLERSDVRWALSRMRACDRVVTETMRNKQRYAMAGVSFGVAAHGAWIPSPFPPGCGPHDWITCDVSATE